MNSKDPIDKFMHGLTNKQRKLVKNVVFYGFVAIMIGALPMAYNYGVTDGKIHYCQDLGLRLVSFHGVEQCMSDDDIEHQRSLVASTKINKDVLDDFLGGQDGLQLNVTN